MKLIGFSICAALLFSLTGCATAPKSEAAREVLVDNSRTVLKQLQGEDPTLEAFLDKAYGYVVFPEVGKAGYVIGGSYGRGAVFEQGTFIGYADISQATIGLQIGGQTFSEVIAFESRADLNRFTGGKLALSANVSAVILKSGAAASARYTDGVAVFVKPIGGAMLEASIGAQQFTYQPR